MTRGAALALVLMRTLVGWHFAYEGLYKLTLPGWTPAGQPIPSWTAAGYLRQAGGPLGPVFHWLGQPPAIGWIDLLVPMGLVAVGLSLLLGIFTQFGCWGGLALLTLFYMSAIPTTGLLQPGAEGAYLFVNKTLVEAGAIVVLLAFRTGEMAGIDVLLLRKPRAIDAAARHDSAAASASTAADGGPR